MENKLIVFADGGSRGNPGPAAAGGVSFDAGGQKKKGYRQKVEYIT